MGLAVGQTITGTATTLPVIPVKNGTPDWDSLDKVVKQWKPDALVIGMPYNMDGSESDMTVKTREFSEILGERFNIPCFGMDERLSTREARNISRSNAEAGGRKFNERAEVDSLAAQLILESWLADNS